MHADAQNLEPGMTKCSGSGQRRTTAQARTARPSYYGPSRKNFSSDGRPDTEMIFRDLNSRLRKCSHCANPIEPRGSDEARYWAADDIFDQSQAARKPGARLVQREAQELAFSGCHEPRPKLMRRPSMRAFVAVIETVEENLATFVRPCAQARGEG
jgi:hypothetical protein